MKSKLFFFIFSLIGISLYGQQKGIGVGTIFNSLNRERVVGFNTTQNASNPQLQYTNIWQNQVHLSYFQTYKQGKRTRFFFTNIAFVKNTDELRLKSIVLSKDSVEHQLYDAKIKRGIIEIGTTRYREYFQSKNEKLRVGLAYTSCLLWKFKQIMPKTAIDYPKSLNLYGIEIRFEPYVSYQINSNLFFDFNVFRLFAVRTALADSNVQDPSFPIGLQRQIYTDFDLQLTSFRNIGLQCGFRYVLVTAKSKKKTLKKH